VRAAVSEHNVIVVARDACDERNRGGKIFNFGRHGERRIDQHRHRQFMAGAIVDNSALRCQRNRPLLLMSRLLDEPAVAENLEIDEPPADGHTPQQEHGSEKVEPGVLAGMGIIRHAEFVVRSPSALSS